MIGGFADFLHNCRLFVQMGIIVQLQILRSCTIPTLDFARYLKGWQIFRRISDNLPGQLDQLRIICIIADDLCKFIFVMHN